MASQLNRNEMKEIAETHGWNPLGVMETEVETPITDKDRDQLGESQAKAILEVRKLEEEKGKINKKFKADIDEYKTLAIECAEIIERGTRIDKKSLPCFFDPIKGKRVFISPVTLSPVKYAEASPEDAQVRMF